MFYMYVTTHMICYAPLAQQVGTLNGLKAVLRIR